MPKKRTKEQKVHARYHYSAPVANVFSENHAKTAAPVPAKKTSVESLYSYDPIYLHQDIRRTIILSLFILALQIGLYLWLH